MLRPLPDKVVVENGLDTATPKLLTVVLINALPVLTPKPSTVVLRSALPVVRPERSSVVVLPRPKGEAEPILTLPLLPRSRLLLSCTSTLPLFTRVSMLLLEPTTSTACPSGFCTVLPSAAFRPKPKLVTPVIAVFTSPILAALDSIVPPLATPWICWLLALIPVAVNVGPPVMLKPLVLSRLFPVVTLSSPVKSFANLMVKVSLPSATTPILLPLVSFVASVSPPFTNNFSPSLRLTLVPLSPPKSMPWFSVPLIPFWRPISCATLTASLLLVPAATFTI